MKKLYILVLSLISLNSVSAQITLTAANNTPSVGFSSTFHYVDATTINSGGTGANVTWDYSSMVTTTSLPSTMVLPSTLSDNANHPLANLASGNSAQQAFYYVDADEFSLEGVYSAQQRDVYSDVREFYKFPISYQDVYNETFSGIASNLQMSQDYDRGGNIQIEGDAYGTLILPYGTINNVLRIKTHTIYADTFMGSVIGSYDDVHYFWFNANTKVPLMTYDEFTLFGNVSYIGGYLDQADVLVGLGEDFVQNSPLMIYPNPASSHVNVALDKNYSNATVQIIDFTGKIIKRELVQMGSKELSFELDDLDKGMYFVQILEEKNIISSEKLMVK